jgi:hypothetical protein
MEPQGFRAHCGYGVGDRFGGNPVCSATHSSAKLLLSISRRTLAHQLRKRWIEV